MEEVVALGGEEPICNGGHVTNVTAVHIVEHAALPLVQRPAQPQAEGAAVVHLLVFSVEKNLEHFRKLVISRNWTNPSVPPFKLDCSVCKERLGHNASGKMPRSVAAHYQLS